MNKIKEAWKKHSRIYMTIAVFLFSFFLLMLVVYRAPIFTDEGDNMLGGIAIGQGGLIYKDFFSQHLPFMYYFFGFFSFLGVDSYQGFRLCACLVMALLLAFVYYRYEKQFGISMLFYPLLFVVSITLIGHPATTITAEYFQTQFLVILLLEFLLFVKNKKLSIGSQFLIGSSIFLSIGISFVSCLPIAVLIIGLFYVDIKEYCQNYSFHLGSYCKHFFQTYYPVLLFIIVPGLLFLGYLVLTGTFQDCYEQAFYLNTEYYSKFNNYHADLFSLIKNTGISYIQNFVQILKNLFVFKTNRLFSLFNLLCQVGIWTFFFKNFKKEKMVVSCVVLFTLLCANRTFDQLFHILPFFIVAFLLSMWALTSYLKNCSYSRYVWITLFVISLGSILPYAPKTFDDLKFSKEIILKLTDPGDHIYLNNLNTYLYVDTKRTPASPIYTLVPWFQELYEEKIIEDLEKTKPKLIGYKPDDSVWGHPYQQYAPKLDAYIKEHYLYVSQIAYWVRKDYKQEAERRLGIEIPDVSSYALNPYPLSLLSNNRVEQVFQATDSKLKAVEFRFYTYSRINYSLVHLKLYKDQNLLREVTIPASQLMDGNYYRFDFDPVELIPDTYYRFELVSEYTNSSDGITLGAVNLENNNYALINGVRQVPNLDMNLYYGG